MKIEKIICDICGEEITESHPTRMEQHEYDKSGFKSVYKKIKTYEICDKCEPQLPNLFKALKGDKK